MKKVEVPVAVWVPACRVVAALFFMTVSIASNRAEESPRRVGLAPFEDLSAVPTTLLRADSVQKELAYHLKADHSLAPSLLRPSTRELTHIPDPNTQLVPPSLRSGGWRGSAPLTTAPNWRDLARRRALDVLVVGTFEQFGPDLRFFAEGLEPLTGASIFTVKVEGTTSEKLDLTARLADRIASQIRIRDLDRSEGIKRDREGFIEPEPEVLADPDVSTTADDHYEAGFALTRRYDQTKDSDLLEGAAKEYRAALAKDPDHFRALNNLGTVLHRLGRYEEAIDYYDRVLEINPTYVRAMENAALAYRSLGKTKEAVAMWRKALLYEDRENIRKVIEETLEKLEPEPDR